MNTRVSLKYFVSYCSYVPNAFIDEFFPSCFTNSKIVKRLQNYQRKLFLCLPQKRRKQSQHFKLLFFTIYLLFVTWNQIPTFRRPNLSLISSIYLGSLPLEIKGKFKQVKVYQTFILFGLKRNDQQTFKSGSRKKRFSPMCMLSIQLALMNPFLYEN